MRDQLWSFIRENGGAEDYLDGKNWRVYEIQTPYRAWKWWDMNAPTRKQWNPDSNFLMSGSSQPALPAGYEISL